MCAHSLWVHILCCFINRASNAALDKAREDGAGRRPLVQLLQLWVLGLRQSFMRVLYNKIMWGIIIGRYSCKVPTAAFLYVTFDRQSVGDKYQIHTSETRFIVHSSPHTD